MKTRKISLQCPLCNSNDVFYSCEPKCCFNHVCADCGATFEPVTVATGARLTSLQLPDPLPDSTEPTVGCEKCESILVYQLEDGTAVCSKCGLVLEIRITEVAPA
ncbi:MAG: hypothetical protein NTY38_25455 [Acidobacteria bacterium]|nr:hypothetical protein [Acidobacteriota bacterium]